MWVYFRAIDVGLVTFGGGGVLPFGLSVIVSPVLVLPSMPQNRIVFPARRVRQIVTADTKSAERQIRIITETRLSYMYDTLPFTSVCVA